MSDTERLVSAAQNALNENDLDALAPLACELASKAANKPHLADRLFPMAEALGKSEKHLAKALLPAFTAYRHGYNNNPHHEAAADLVFKAANEADSELVDVVVAMSYFVRCGSRARSEAAIPEVLCRVPTLQALNTSLAEEATRYCFNIAQDPTQKAEAASMLEFYRWPATVASARKPEKVAAGKPAAAAAAPR